MTDKKYTLLIIPEGSHKVRRYMISRKWLGIGGGLAAATLLVCLVILFDYIRTGVDRHELKRLRSQNQTQQSELRLLANRLEDVRKEMVILAQNDAKMRAMTQLSHPVKASNVLAGVGGPAEAPPESEITDLQQQIDQIREAIDLRRASQEEIRGFLTDQRSMLAAKPKGWPVRGWLTSDFGMRLSPFTRARTMHEGFDIAARIGTPVYATADGIVSQAQFNEGYGKLVVIDHGYGYKTYFAHNSRLLVKVGQRVKRGDTISAVGNTGSSTGAHLHYEVRLNGIPLNPQKFI